MKPIFTQPSNSQSVDRKVLLLLRRKGAHTIEGLTMLTGIGWGQVYLSVDRLSRTGKVSLTPVYPSEYRVSVREDRQGPTVSAERRTVAEANSSEDHV